MKYLDVGSGKESSAGLFKDRGELEVTRLDGDPNNHPDILHDMLNPLPEEHQGVYDLVLSSHMLEHVDYRQVARVLRHTVQAAKMGGEVMVFVPSMEWAAREILMGRDDLGLQATIFGGQGNPWDYHRVGFTRGLLASALMGAGCKDIRVGEAHIEIYMDGILYPSHQNMAQGFRER